MGAPSAISSGIASISLTGAKTYDLHNVSTQQTEQIYEELDYNCEEVVPSTDPYTIATQKLIEDKTFVEKVLEKLKEKLNEINYNNTDVVVQNVGVLAPTLIKICDHSEDLQYGKTVDEYIIGVENTLIDFGFKDRDLLSKKMLTDTDQKLVTEAAQELVLETIGAENTFLGDLLNSEAAATKSYIKSILKKFTGKVIKTYGDDVLLSLLGNYGDDVLRFSRGILGQAPFATSCFIDCAFSGFDDVIGTLQKRSFGKFTSFAEGKVDIIGSMSGAFIPQTAAQLSSGIAAYVTSSSSFLQLGGNFKFTHAVSRNVESFLHKSLVSGSKEAFLKKWFLPKDCITSAEFATEFVKATSKKAIVCKAIGSGVASLVVSSLVSLIGTTVSEIKSGETIGTALIEGGKAVMEDLPRNTVIAVGTAVGTLAGSALGGAIGSLIAPPIGTYIGTKIGGFLGGLIGGFAGDLICNIAEADMAAGGEKAWYKPWTWFS